MRVRNRHTPSSSDGDTDADTDSDTDADADADGDTDACEGVLSFRSSALEEAVRDEIDTPTGDLYSDDVEGTESLFAGDTLDPVRNLRGIQCLSGLNVLDLSFNELSSLAPLGFLTGLTVLDLTWSGVTDIGPLANLVNLRELTLDQNGIADLSPLAPLTALKELSLTGADVSSISALSGLIALRNLNLMDNNISYIDALAGLSNLKDLELSVHRIETLTPLVENNGIGSGDDLSIAQNRLDCTDTEMLDDIATLEAGGVGLYHDCDYAGSDARDSSTGSPRLHQFMIPEKQLKPGITCTRCCSASRSRTPNIVVETDPLAEFRGYFSGINLYGPSPSTRPSPSAPAAPAVSSPRRSSSAPPSAPCSVTGSTPSFPAGPVTPAPTPSWGWGPWSPASPTPPSRPCSSSSSSPTTTGSSRPSCSPA